MGSRRANPVDGLNYNPRTAISFLDAANSLQFFSWPTFSLSFLKKLTRFPFISPPSLVYFYSNNQQVHLRENEFLRPRSSHYEAVEQPRDGLNKSKEVLLSGVCESITAKFLITRRQETPTTSESWWRHTPFIIYVLTRAISTTLYFHAFNCAWREFPFESLPPPPHFSFLFVILLYLRNPVSIFRGKIRGRISSFKLRIHVCYIVLKIIGIVFYRNCINCNFGEWYKLLKIDLLYEYAC